MYVCVVVVVGQSAVPARKTGSSQIMRTTILYFEVYSPCLLSAFHLLPTFLHIKCDSPHVCAGWVGTHPCAACGSYWSRLAFPSPERSLHPCTRKWPDYSTKTTNHHLGVHASVGYRNQKGFGTIRPK